MFETILQFKMVVMLNDKKRRIYTDFNKTGVFGYFCTKPRKGILRNEKYIISNIFKLFSGS